MSDHGDTVSLRSGEGEILHVTPPKRPVLSLIRSLIFGNSKGQCCPIRITLNKQLFHQFEDQNRSLRFELDQGHPIASEEPIGVLFYGVPVWWHEEETPIILSLPDYGVTE